MPVDRPQSGRLEPGVRVLSSDPERRGEGVIAQRVGRTNLWLVVFDGRGGDRVALHGNHLKVLP